MDNEVHFLLVKTIQIGFAFLWRTGTNLMKILMFSLTPDWDVNLSYLYIVLFS